MSENLYPDGGKGDGEEDIEKTYWSEHSRPSFAARLINVG